MEQWDQLFDRLHSFVLMVSLRESDPTQSAAENILISLDNYIAVLSSISYMYTLQTHRLDEDIEVRELKQDIDELLEALYKADQVAMDGFGSWHWTS